MYRAADDILRYRVGGPGTRLASSHHVHGVTSDFVPRFRTEFGVPEDFQPIGALLVGHRHPDVAPNFRPERRKQEEQLVFFGAWGQSKQ